MSQLFSSVKVGNTQRSTFDLSHHQVTSSDFGYLIPVCYRDMVPNDDFVVTPNIFCRLAPMASPTYGRITCRLHSFFVPYRILYPHWDAFITQDGSNHTIPPYYLATSLQQALNTDPLVSTGQGIIGSRRGVYSRVMSNLGLNPHAVKAAQINERFSAFPFLAYYRIWLDWFMDSSIYDHPTMVAEFNDAIKNGGDLYAANPSYIKFIETRYSCYKKDYFTTARINPQDGNPSLVAVDVAGSDLNPGLTPSTVKPIQLTSVGNVYSNDSLASSGNTRIGQFTIEALRAANSLQRYLERNNFVGSKLINRILAHFGVAPTPERLDMAEFIGGSSFPIQIGDVTSSNSISSFDDQMGNNINSSQGIGIEAGKGVGAGKGQSVRYHAKEHGIFMTLMSIVPDTAYFQGISRFWSKGLTGDALDFFTPEFENLGYQEILNKELYATGSYNGYQREGIFGYSPRYSEYKFQQDVLGGDFISTIATGEDPAYYDYTSTFFSPLNSWHLFRNLSYSASSPVALNSNFVEMVNRNTDYDRIFQYTNPSYDHFYFNIDCDVKATRPMMGFGEPSLSANDEGDGNRINLPYGGTRL